MEEEIFGEITVEDLTKNFEELLLVLKENDIKLTNKMTKLERMTILGKINTLRSQLINDMK
jgi:hypothetical protein